MATRLISAVLESGRRYLHAYMWMVRKPSMTDPLPNRSQETRPWGSFERFTLNEVSSVKLLHVEPGKKLSLQYHGHRSEFWRVLSGSGTVRIGDEVLQANEGDEFFIPQGAKHRIMTTDEELHILELWLGEGDENDIVRLEDEYGR